MSTLRITNGTVYDPTNQVDGAQKDIWIQDGRIIAPPTDPNVQPDRTIDAAGYVVMAGGVDMHAHIAGPKVNVARKMPESVCKSQGKTDWEAIQLARCGTAKHRSCNRPRR